MKVRLFNKGKGWYVSATNYKNNNDKAYMNVHFTREAGEPEVDMNDKGYSVKDIKIIEGKFNSYKGVVGLTVFKYEQISDIDLEEKRYQQPLNDGDSDMFGRKNIIDEKDLPFL